MYYLGVKCISLLQRIKKEYFIFLMSIFFLSLGTSIFSFRAQAQEKDAGVRCYANKCYGITVDCPDLCLQGYIDISFDSKGNSGLDTYFNGKFVGKQKKSNNKYVAKIDSTNDNKTDLIFVLNFSECGTDSCKKVTGTLTYKKVQGGVLRVCEMNGYAVNCGGASHPSMYPQKTSYPGNINGRVTDSATDAAIPDATITSTSGVTATTDENGYYADAHPAGNFLVRAQASGYYSSAWIPVTVFPGVTNIRLTEKLPVNFEFSGQ